MEMQMQWIKRPVLISLASLLVILAILGGGWWWWSGGTGRQADEFVGPIQTNLTLNQEEYLIGDEMLLTLTIWTEPGYQVESPTITPPEGVELVEQTTGAVQETRDYFKYIDHYRFRTFTPGTYDLGKITIGYTTADGTEQELTLDGPTLTVQSLLTAEASDIRDLKPVAEPGQWIGWYLLGALVVLLAVLGYLFYRLYWRKRKAKEVAPDAEAVIPAHLRAYQRLEELEQAGYLEKGEIERYFTVLSQILREYIEHRFGVKAQEMTTQEFLAQALQGVALTDDHQQLLRDFMIKADLVKYARHIPDYQQIQEGFQAAKRFVDETKLTEEMLAQLREQEESEDQARQAEEEAGCTAEVEVEVVCESTDVIPDDTDAEPVKGGETDAPKSNL